MGEFEENPQVQIHQFVNIYKQLGKWNRVDVEVTISDFPFEKEGNSSRRLTWTIDDPVGNGKTVMVTWNEQSKNFKEC